MEMPHQVQGAAPEPRDEMYVTGVDTAALVKSRTACSRKEREAAQGLQHRIDRLPK